MCSRVQGWLSLSLFVSALHNVRTPSSRKLLYKSSGACKFPASHSAMKIRQGLEGPLNTQILLDIKEGNYDDRAKGGTVHQSYPSVTAQRASQEVLMWYLPTGMGA